MGDGGTQVRVLNPGKNDVKIDGKNYVFNVNCGCPPKKGVTQKPVMTNTVVKPKVTPKPKAPVNPVTTDCKPCQRGFFGRLWDGIKGGFRVLGNLGCGVLSATASLFGGALSLAGGLVGCAVSGLSAGLASAACMPRPVCAPGMQMTSSMFSYMPLYSPAPSMYNSSFASGMLFGSMMNRHHHCHHGPYPRPLVVHRTVLPRPMIGPRPFCRPCRF